MLPRTGATLCQLSHLEGGLSGRRYEADQLVGLDPHDGRPLLCRYDLDRVAATLSPGAIQARRGGMWRWHELLPVRQWAHVVSLGEGGTPLLDAPRLGAAFGMRHLLVKAESLNPTGSFKARGMAAAVSRAVELGAAHLIAPSAGNAAGALAAYAAAAGIPATVVMPADAPLANQVEVGIAGARLVLVEGLISDCGRLAKRMSEVLGAFDLSTLKEPYRVEGKKTLGLELAEDLGWKLPDAVVYPTGGGTGLVGMWKAFAELEAIGLLSSHRPRLISVQAEGCAPIVRAFDAGERFAPPWERASTRAAGLRVPGAVGDFLILDAIRASGGCALAVPETEIAAMQGTASRAGWPYPSLETSAALAALPALLEAALISHDERVVVFDTGAGFKSEPPVHLRLPTPIANDDDAWSQLLDS